MNLTALLAAIQAKGYTTDTATQQIAFINEIYREVHGQQRWKFLEKQDSTLTTVVGTPNYTPPMTDWRNFDAVRINDAALTTMLNLKYLSPQDYHEYYHIDRSISSPYYWTLMANQIWFYPVPDMPYQVVIDYIYEPPDLAVGTDVPVLPLPYHDILVWGAVENLAYRERDWLGRQFSEQKKEALLNRMKEEYWITQRQTSTQVKKSGYWDTQLPYPFLHDGF